MKTTPSEAAREIRAARYAGTSIDASVIASQFLSTDTATIDLLLEAAQYYRFANTFVKALEFTNAASEIATTLADSLRVATLEVHILLALGRFDEAKIEIQKLIDRYKIINPGVTLGEILGVIKMKDERSKSKNSYEAYWRQRHQFVYLHVCKQLIKVIAASAKSVVDIGSNKTPILNYFRRDMRRYSVDPMTPFDGSGVIQIRKNFQDWTPPESINIGTCFQVIEHIPNCEEFCRAILERCEVCLISVPYLEEPGVNPGHIHSMIDEKTIFRWFGREPNYDYIAKELSGSRRIICLFDRTTTKPFSGMHVESADSLRYRFRWSLDGAGVKAATVG